MSGLMRFLVLLEMTSPIFSILYFDIAPFLGRKRKSRVAILAGTPASIVPSSRGRGLGGIGYLYHSTPINGHFSLSFLCDLCVFCGSNFTTRDTRATKKKCRVIDGVQCILCRFPEISRRSMPSRSVSRSLPFSTPLARHELITQSAVNSIQYSRAFASCAVSSLFLWCWKHAKTKAGMERSVTTAGWPSLCRSTGSIPAVMVVLMSTPNLAPRVSCVLSHRFPCRSSHDIP